jgi:hypothetical protein
MEGIFDKLGLRPAERRLLVGVAVLLFIVFNVYFIWPQFKEWGKLKGDIAALTLTRTTYEQERDKLPEYQQKEAELRGRSPAVPASGIGSQLVKEVQNQASQLGKQFAYIKQIDGAQTERSKFFEEKIVNVRFSSWTDTNVLKLLISLGEGSSVIRIRDLSIKPDPSRMKLTGNATMVASYQKADPQ